MGKFTRQVATRQYKRLITVSCEGGVTEPKYLARLQQLCGYGTVCIQVLKDTGKSSPKGVLKRMRMCRTSVRPGDEQWCMLDKDQWTDAQLREIRDWAEASDSAVFRGVALSNPKVELWLLAHFRDVSVRDCSPKRVVTELEAFLPGYDKSLTGMTIDSETVRRAIQRCRSLPSGEEVPWDCCGTSVGNLAAHIFRAAGM